MISLFRDEEEHFIKTNFHSLLVNNLLRMSRKEKRLKRAEKYLLIPGEHDQMSLRKGSEWRLTLAEDWSNINLSAAGSREVGQNVYW